jgi:hypothetical protein
MLPLAATAATSSLFCLHRTRFSFACFAAMLCLHDFGCQCILVSFSVQCSSVVFTFTSSRSSRSRTEREFQEVDDDLW